MATYDNEFNPYGDKTFKTLGDYQQWMKTSLDGVGVKTPWLTVDNKMGKNTATAMNMVQSKGLLQPSVVAQTTANAFNANPQPAPTVSTANSAQPTTFSSGLFGKDPTLNNGAFNSDDMAKYLSSPVSDKVMAGDGVGLYNGTLNGVQTQFDNSNLHTADAGSIRSASLDGTTYGGSNDQWINGLSNFETLQGAAGLGNLAMGLYGMFGENGTNAINKKNMQLIDQQIANNRDIMKTRTERAADIKKYFG